MISKEKKAERIRKMREYQAKRKAALMLYEEEQRKQLEKKQRKQQKRKMRFAKTTSRICTFL